MLVLNVFLAELYNTKKCDPRKIMTTWHGILLVVSFYTMLVAVLV